MRQIILFLFVALLSTTAFSQEPEKEQTDSGKIIMSVFSKDYVVEGDTTNFSDPDIIIELTPDGLKIDRKNRDNLYLTYARKANEDEDGNDIFSLYDSNGKKYYVKMISTKETEEYPAMSAIYLSKNKADNMYIYYCTYLTGKVE